MATESQDLASASPPECLDNWQFLQGNIPTLYELCRDAIRRHDVLRDAVFLNDVLLPDHIAEDILDDRDDVDGRPVACREGEEFTECGCLSFFNPGSAVFVNEDTAVLLEGRCCLKKAIVKIANDGDDIRWLPTERTPNAFVRNGICSRKFVLRSDGAIVGVCLDTLCILPPDDEDGAVHVKLEFSTSAAVHYYDILLPSLIRSFDVIFAVGMYRRRGGSVRCFDVLAINTRTGVVSAVSPLAKTGSEYGSSGFCGRIQPTIPSNFEPSNLVELRDHCLVVTGCIPEDAFNLRGGAHPVVCTCSVSDHEYHPSEWVLDWKCVNIFRGEGARISHLNMSSSVVASSSEPSNNACVVIFNKGGVDMNSGQVFTSSIDGGQMWNEMKLCRQRLTTMGVTNDPPLVAFDPSGQLYAFGYDERSCQIAEQKSLLRQSKRRMAVQWPSMNVYRWSGTFIGKPEVR